MFQTLHHQNITVTDIERSKRFYTEVLGLEVMDELYVDEPAFGEGAGRPGAKVHALFLSVPGADAFLELLQYDPPGPARAADASVDSSGLGHVALKVSDIQDVYSTLSARGVEFVSKPVTMSNGVRWCYFRDPDGILLEIIEIPD